MWLPYQNAFQIAAVLVVLVVSLHRVEHRGDLERVLVGQPHAQAIVLRASCR